MGEKKTTPIVINGVEHQYENLTAEQQALFNHCVDLDRKINSAKFNIDQLMVGKEAFIKMLEQSLTAAEQTTQQEEA